MKYSELKAVLESMSAEQLAQDVTVWVEDEFVPVTAAVFSDDSIDVLDRDHLFLEI